MRLKAIMHDLFKTCGTNSKTVSVNMGRDQSFLSAALMRPAIRTDTLCEIADIVGYEVVLRPKRSPSKRARNPEEFVLDYVDPSNPVSDDEKDEDE